MKWRRNERVLRPGLMVIRGDGFPELPFVYIYYETPNIIESSAHHPSSTATLSTSSVYTIYFIRW
jgi:hypothetical protein